MTEPPEISAQSFFTTDLMIKEFQWGEDGKPYAALSMEIHMPPEELALMLEHIFVTPVMLKVTCFP